MRFCKNFRSILILLFSIALIAFAVSCDSELPSGGREANQENSPQAEKPIAGHAHTFSKDWLSDENCHWRKATCEHEDLVSEKGEHSFPEEWQDDDDRQYRECSVCGYEQTRDKESANPGGGEPKEGEGGEAGDKHNTDDSQQNTTDESLFNITEDGVLTVKDKSKLPEKVVIPDAVNGIKVTSIGYCAFRDCNKLQSVNIPDTVTEIGEHAFSRCSSLQSVLIPSSVSIIGKYAFEYCSCECVFAEGTIRIPDYALYFAGMVTKVVIPDTVTEIGEHAFCGCKKIEFINIPDSVVKIEENAFLSCSIINVYFSSLESYLSIPFLGYSSNPVTHALNFYINDELVSGVVEIPWGIKQIPDYAFYGCSNIKSLIIPESVTDIGYCAFYDCPCEIIFAEGTTKIPDKILYGDKTNKVMKVTIPNTVIEIGKYAFRSFPCEIIFSEGMTRISDYALSGADKVTKVYIPSTVNSIGNGAFIGCDSLEDVYVSSLESYLNISFSEISSYPMAEASNLYVNGELLSGVVEIPSGIKQIPYWAFSNCTKIKKVIIPSSVISMSGSSFNNCPCEIIFTDGITKILDKSLYKADKITKVVIPNTVTEIGSEAFYGCSSIKSITIPSSITEIGSGAFDKCSCEIIFADGATSIPNKALSGASNVTKVTIPQSVTEIGSGAFSGCSSLQNVVIPSSVTSIGGLAFYKCSGLTSIVVPSSVTSMGNAAFSGCSFLQSIIISPLILEIGTEVFYGCSSLQSIEIPSSVTSIGRLAFYKCSGLSFIEIPSSVTKIAEYAFLNCSDLASISFNGTKSQWGSIGKDNSWNYNVPATVVHCTDGDVAI